MFGSHAIPSPLGRMVKNVEIPEKEWVGMGGGCRNLLPCVCFLVHVIQAGNWGEKGISVPVSPETPSLPISPQGKNW